MYLNTIQPAPGSKHNSKRLGRGIGSGRGKTCGKGHKGQKARAGGYHKIGFEGGQMPLQRRIPKSGFRSQGAILHREVRLSDLNKMDGELVDLSTLKANGLVNANIKSAKIVLAGELTKKITVKGVKVTAGAKSAIESLGGKVEV